MLTDATRAKQVRFRALESSPRDYASVISTNVSGAANPERPQRAQSLFIRRLSIMRIAVIADDLQRVFFPSPRSSGSAASAGMGRVTFFSRHPSFLGEFLLLGTAASFRFRDASSELLILREAVAMLFITYHAANFNMSTMLKSLSLSLSLYNNNESDKN